MNYFSKLILFTSITMCAMISSCGEDESPLPLLGVAFETSAVGLSSNESSTDVVISLSRATTVESQATINVTETGVQNDVDYSTTPAISNGSLTIDIPVGSESVSFKVTRSAEIIAPGSNIVFTLSEISGDTNVEIAGNTSLTFSFEAIASAGSSFTANIGGATEPNQVFVDFSLNEQTTSERISWDLGFYNGGEDKVILNYSTFGMARAIDKTDITSVTAQDTVGFASEMKIGTAGAHIFIDHPDRDLEKLAIADISATDTDNKVYIINRGNGPGTGSVDSGSVDVSSTPLGWKKVRITKNAGDYVIQYADISSTTFEEATVSKDPNSNFVYFSLDNGINTAVEPPKEQWDIVFSVSSNIINFGAGDGAYGFSDFVLSNRQDGVEVARIQLDRDDDGIVIAGQTSYDDFSSANLGDITFSKDGNIIGSSWRSVFSRTAHDYVYFIIKDAEGNNYKVQFLGLLNQDGIRGNSSLKYELL